MYVRKNTKSKPRKSRPRARKSYSKKRAVSSIAKQVVSRMAETKIANAYVASLPISNYVVGAYGVSTYSFQVIQLTPNALTLPITQGSGQQNRVGNKIVTKGLNFRGMVFARPYTTVAPACTDPRPYLVKMWILWDKSAATGNVQPYGLNFFQSGSTTASPTGTNLDTFLQVNKDRYSVVASKLFKVGLSGYSGGTTGMSTPASYAYWHNNDFKYANYFNFNLTKHCIKNMIFNDTSNDPTVRGLYCICEAVSTAGENMASLNYPVALTYEVNYSFTDL